jgi:hypothetical protein
MNLLHPESAIQESRGRRYTARTMQASLAVANVRYHSAVKYFAASILVVILLAGCARTSSRRQFGPLGPVSQIDVWVHQRDGSSDIFTIRDPKEIATVVAFVDQRSGDWQTPWYGIRVPTVEARFYDGKTFKGHFGVGRDYFECQRYGVFASRPASAADIHEFLNVIGVDDDTFKKVTP